MVVERVKFHCYYFKINKPKNKILFRDIKRFYNGVRSMVVKGYGAIVDLIFERERGQRKGGGGKNYNCGVTQWRPIVVEGRGDIVDLRFEREREI